MSYRETISNYTEPDGKNLEHVVIGVIKGILSTKGSFTNEEVSAAIEEAIKEYDSISGQIRVGEVLDVRV